MADNYSCQDRFQGGKLNLELMCEDYSCNVAFVQVGDGDPEVYMQTQVKRGNRYERNCQGGYRCDKEPCDYNNVFHTAARECFEEIGLEERNVEHLQWEAKVKELLCKLYKGNDPRLSVKLMRKDRKGRAYGILHISFRLLVDDFIDDIAVSSILVDKEVGHPGNSDLANKKEKTMDLRWEKLSHVCVTGEQHEKTNKSDSSRAEPIYYTFGVGPKDVCKPHRHTSPRWVEDKHYYHGTERSELFKILCALIDKINDTNPKRCGSPDKSDRIVRVVGILFELYYFFEKDCFPEKLQNEIGWNSTGCVCPLTYGQLKILREWSMVRSK
mmetsp:Transcript_4800/g.13435  ORF Transcript_4800/g.13435 Transcript_4800/m.13435 type:complete len:327 (+) Transcript_4800:85-1065(+)|eukprot:CAMPEP_0119143356 /NCGR_PEP_ID=MMETSP1310-20130426/34204_1 /TAXON_ID=464262 /ORGANISM="Genus nov. species nov., Strain RCC2339" /LENGTH=326 /DNA_ID=CAMNT_0007134979 /DNA_START=80 /DNA_END=1060 /DNA_ORIENTATION=+